MIVDKDLIGTFKYEFAGYLFIQIVSTVIGAAFLWVFFHRFVDEK